jgi:hypothetical protein
MTASITVVPGPVVQVGFTVQPSDLVLGNVFSPPIQASPLDTFGNVAEFHGSISLSLASGPPDAKLLGTIAVPVSGGVATFANVTISRDGKGYAVWAGSNGLTPALSKTFSVTKP